VQALQSSIEAVTVAAKAANDAKAMDIMAFDVAEAFGITDVFLLITGDNERQVLSIAEKVERRLKESLGLKPASREGIDDARWILLDYYDFVIHIMHKESRKFYSLERLWKDCPEIDLHLEHQLHEIDNNQEVDANNLVDVQK
jgi:ribosome-associated protein